MSSAKSLIDFSDDSVTLKAIFSRSSWSDSSSEMSSEYSLIRPFDIFSSSSSFVSVIVVGFKQGRWCGVSDAGLTAAGVSDVASRSFTATRRIAVKLRLAVNVLTSFCL